MKIRGDEKKKKKNRQKKVKHLQLRQFPRVTHLFNVSKQSSILKKNLSHILSAV